MSRIEYNESDDILSYGRWEGRVKMALKGKPGQAMLRELEAALEAMPEQRLIYARLCDANGGVCALGALITHRYIAGGLSEFDARRKLHRLSYGSETDYEVAAFAVRQIGITNTLAWLIQEANDELAPSDPEARHAFVLRWVRSKIKEPAS